MTTVPTAFDRLFASAAARVTTGDHSREVVPEEGGRWPISLLLYPPAALAEALAPLTCEALRLAGPGQVVSGHPEAAHITVRALEPRREAARKDEPFVQRCTAALDRTTAALPAPRFTLTGVTLTPGTVMAQLETTDGWEVMHRLDAELGADGWYEREWAEELGRPAGAVARDIHYVNLVHFADDLADPTGLVQWVRAHRAIEPVTFTVPTAGLVAFRHETRGDHQLIRMEPWHQSIFTG
ncbi:hypothetical protein P4R38_07635 [Luteipulveratus sp. YIM 133296]|uniref:2'-5' RNA ligase family protein n=1 Tax=Luteipulveratus flavus TaxID=3031728 RepID=A0ABT6C6Z7_9MICO|nr:hypothetical protein [Luteipulveratus sp. YIM 133296]